MRGRRVAAFRGGAGGNASVREHIVRDTRQQMERRGPERLTAVILHREKAVGGEALHPLNNYHNLIIGEAIMGFQISSETMY